MSAWGWDEPAPYMEPPDYSDRDYDAMVVRVDSGEQCPVCKEIHPAAKTVVMGIPLFTCAKCRSDWFDFLTRPTVEA